MTEETGVVESPQASEEVLNVADVSTDDLRHLMTGTEPVETAESIDQPETEQTELVSEEPQEVELLETEEERLAKRRIRPRTALDQQVLDLYKSEAFDGSFADASRIIYQQEAPAQNLQSQQAPEDKRPDPVAYYDARVSELHAEIAELEEKVTEAADNLETSDALKLQREVTRRELEAQRLTGIKDSEIRRRREAVQDTHRTKAVESRDRALDTFPELQDRESVTRKQFDEYVKHAQGDPDYASVFESPKWPEIMVREFQAAINAQQQQQQAPAQHAPAMGTQAKVLTTGTTTQPANAPVTAQQVASNMGQMSNDQLYALLGDDDGRRFLR